MEEACHWIRRPLMGWCSLGDCIRLGKYFFASCLSKLHPKCQGAFEQCLRQSGRESRKRCHGVVDMASTSISAWLPGFVMLAAAAVALLLVPKAMQSACLTREELGTSWFHQIQLRAASSSFEQLQTAYRCLLLAAASMPDCARPGGT